MGGIKAGGDEEGDCEHLSQQLTTVTELHDLVSLLCLASGILGCPTSASSVVRGSKCEGTYGISYLEAKIQNSAHTFLRQCLTLDTGLLVHRRSGD